MNKIIVLLSLILFSLSCTEATPSNRGANSEGTRKPTENACTDGDTSIQCATTYSGLMISQIYRSKGAKQLSYDEVSTLIAQGQLPTGTYRTVPDIEIDNDSAIEVITSGFNQEYAKRDCGVAVNLTSARARRNSCLNFHENYEGANDQIERGKSIWDGKTLGNSGEGQWELVLNIVDEVNPVNNISLWFDTKTKLIWSHALINQEWNSASGTDKTISICNSLNELTKTETRPEGQIAWRMPNRNEFLQADLNGARYVLDSGDKVFWTSSTGPSQSKAWAIKQATGELELQEKTNANFVRCIGVEI